MFAIGDLVVYGGSGVCRVKDISTIRMDGIPKDKLYYILAPHNRDDSHIYAPVENCKIVMRKALTRAEGQALIEEIPMLEAVDAGNDRQREQLYREIIKSCDCRRIISVIKTLWLRGQERLRAGKKLSSLDERYLKLAEDALYEELALALELEKKEVISYIEQHMKALIEA